MCHQLLESDTFSAVPSWNTSAIQCIAIQYNTIFNRCSTVQYHTVLSNSIQYSPIAVHYSTLQNSTIEYTIVQYNTIQYNTIEYNIEYNRVYSVAPLPCYLMPGHTCTGPMHWTALLSIAQYFTSLYNTDKHCTILYITAQDSITLCNTAKKSTVQQWTTLYNTVQHTHCTHCILYTL